MGSSPQGSNCQWVTVSGDNQARSAEQGLSRGKWGKSQSWPPLQGAPVHPASDQWWSGGIRALVGVCVLLTLQSPHCGLYWPRPGLEEAVTLSPPLPPPGSTICPGYHLQDLLPHPPHGWPEEPEGQLRLAPGSLSNDSWAGSEDPALRALPAELSLCQNWTLEGKPCLRTCPFLSEQKLTLMRYLREQLPDPDLAPRSRALTARCLNTSPCSCLSFLGKGFPESFQAVWGF